MAPVKVSICRWLNDASFAYSAIYDESFVEVLANAYPIHGKYGIPGHLPVVVGQLGQARKCYKSSLNGFFHMGVEHLRFLISKGWSVSNHSYSHFVYPDQPGLDLYKEIVYSRYLLEDRLGVPITYFTVPNNVGNHAPSLPFVKQAGYLGCKLPVTGELNRDDVDLMKIKGIRLSSGPAPHNYRPDELLTENITLDAIEGAWLCETTHLVQYEPIQPHKNISCEHLDRRLAKIQEIGGDNYWPAVPESVVDYILTRRNLRISNVYDDGEIIRFCIEGELPVGVRSNLLTVCIAETNLTKDATVHIVPTLLASSEEPVLCPSGDNWLLTFLARAGQTIEVRRCPKA